MTVTPPPIQQAAAIPVHAGRVCLIQSSSRRRWIVPKGHIESGATDEETARQEAGEGAGVLGSPQPPPVGRYFYEPLAQIYQVTVFLMDATDVTQQWPEADRRERRWLPPGGAIEQIEDLGLRQL